MKLDRGYSLKEFAELIGAQMKGPADHVITGINEIHKVVPGDLVFVDHPKYYEKALASAATTVLIDNADVECPAGKALLISEQPFRDFNAFPNISGNLFEIHIFFKEISRTCLEIDLNHLY